MTVVYTLETALQRIAELEAELATRPKRRAARKVAGPECQYCRDTKTPKTTYIGLPLCADWKPCAARQRRATKAGAAVAFAWDKRYRTRPELGRWVARFNGEVIGVAGTQAEGRVLAHEHWERHLTADAVAA